MLDLIWHLAIFIFGISIGKVRATNIDITNQTEYMQELIDEAYKKRDNMKTNWLDANERAETWERRYWNLWESINQEEEEEVGS